MAEELQLINSTDKEQVYQSLIPQIAELIKGETDIIANMANMAAALKQQFNWLWVGFYLIKGSELVLGPFQGPIACTRIQYGAGVCGAAWKEMKTIVVDDVDQFSGHIACSSLSRSEIVVPIFDSKGVMIAVLDADSESVNTYNKVDAIYLEKMVSLLN